VRPADRDPTDTEQPDGDAADGHQPCGNIPQGNDPASSSQPIGPSACRPPTETCTTGRPPQTCSERYSIALRPTAIAPPAAFEIQRVTVALAAPGQYQLSHCSAEELVNPAAAHCPMVQASLVLQLAA
jgi:hypothetical protein